VHAENEALRAELEALKLATDQQREAARQTAAQAAHEQSHLRALAKEREQRQQEKLKEASQ